MERAIEDTNSQGSHFFHKLICKGTALYFHTSFTSHLPTSSTNHRIMEACETKPRAKKYVNSVCKKGDFKLRFQPAKYRRWSLMAGWIYQPKAGKLDSTMFSYNLQIGPLSLQSLQSFQLPGNSFLAACFLFQHDRVRPMHKAALKINVCSTSGVKNTTGLHRTPTRAGAPTASTIT